LRVPTPQPKLSLGISKLNYCWIPEAVIPHKATRHTVPGYASVPARTWQMVHLERLRDFVTSPLPALLLDTSEVTPTVVRLACIVTCTTVWSHAGLSPVRTARYSMSYIQPPHAASAGLNAVTVTDGAAATTAPALASVCEPVTLMVAQRAPGVSTPYYTISLDASDLNKIREARNPASYLGKLRGQLQAATGSRATSGRYTLSEFVLFDAGARKPVFGSTGTTSSTPQASEPLDTSPRPVALQQHAGFNVSSPPVEPASVTYRDAPRFTVSPNVGNTDSTAPNRQQSSPARAASQNRFAPAKSSGVRGIIRAHTGLTQQSTSTGAGSGRGRLHRGRRMELLLSPLRSLFSPTAAHGSHTDSASGSGASTARDRVPSPGSPPLRPAGLRAALSAPHAARTRLALAAMVVAPDGDASSISVSAGLAIPPLVMAAPSVASTTGTGTQPATLARLQCGAAEWEAGCDGHGDTKLLENALAPVTGDTRPAAPEANATHAASNSRVSAARSAIRLQRQSIDNSGGVDLYAMCEGSCCTCPDCVCIPPVVRGGQMNLGIQAHKANTWLVVVQHPLTPLQAFAAFLAQHHVNGHSQ
jgi:hypothetical protein